MKLFELSGILIFITSLSMGIFVLCKTPKIFTNRIWAYFTFTVAGWGLSIFLISINIDPKQSLLLWKSTYAINITGIALLFLYFIYQFLNIPRNLFLFANILIGLFFSIEALLGNLINHVDWSFNSFYYSGRPATFLHLIYFIWWILVIFYSHVLLIINFKKVNGLKREQIKYFFIATSIGFTGGITFCFPSFGVNLYPYGILTVSLYPLIMTYAILKYNFMNINIIIRRSLIYSLLISSITLIFIISILISERLFHQVFQHENITTTFIMISLIALIFIPLRNTIQGCVDKIFFKGSQFEIAQENIRLREEVSHIEKMKTVALIASGLAHEIKNPITAIQTFTEYLPQKKNDNQFIEQYTKIVSQEANRINDLIQELLTFSKPSEPKFESIDPNQLIQNLIKLLSSQITKNHIEINLNLTKTSSIIQADPSQLKQALLNIILNAIDAMPTGGILTINTSTPPLSYKEGKGELKQSQYIITISDTGHGINPKDLPHIFEPFFTKKEKGTGLGLAITQGIIEKHGGKIKVESKVNKGTLFIVTMETK